jgi:hypothetical protein
MAFSTTPVAVTITAIDLESLTSVRIHYTLALAESGGTIFPLQPPTSGALSLLLNLTPGDPIPSALDLCLLLQGELASRFGGTADSITVGGQTYPWPPPGP